MNYHFVCLVLSLLLLHPSLALGAGVSPKLIKIYEKQAQNAGSKFVLFCSVQEGAQPLQFEWNKDGHRIQTIEGVQEVKTFDDHSQLSIHQLAGGDSGTYTCVVGNQFGEDRQSTQLKVEGK